MLGELYDVTLVFEHAGERTVQFWAQDIGEQGFDQKERESAMYEHEEHEHEEHKRTAHKHTDHDAEK